MWTAEYWIERLGLLEHPEGGYYRRTYESGDILSAEGLPERFGGERPVSTAIHYLLLRDKPSRLHRIRSDELWHFYAGGAAVVYTFAPGGQRRDLLLGPNPERGQHFQVTVPHGSWFAAEVLEGAYSLFGCTVSPGFDFNDLELAERAQLQEQFPEHRDLIERLTRDP